MPSRWCGHRCEGQWLAKHVVHRGAERIAASQSRPWGIAGWKRVHTEASQGVAG